MNAATVEPIRLLGDPVMCLIYVIYVLGLWAYVDRRRQRAKDRPSHFMPAMIAHFLPLVSMILTEFLLLRGRIELSDFWSPMFWCLAFVFGFQVIVAASLFERSPPAASSYRSSLHSAIRNSDPHSMLNYFRHAGAAKDGR